MSQSCFVIVVGFELEGGGRSGGRGASRTNLHGLAASTGAEFVSVSARGTSCSCVALIAVENGNAATHTRVRGQIVAGSTGQTARACVANQAARYI